jgi:hypothetical protein
VTFEPERTRRGWRLTLAHNGDAVVLDVVGARIRDGVVRAAITVRRAEAIVSQDVVTVTREAERARFVEALAERGIPIPEQALVALDGVCRESGEVRRDDQDREREPDVGPVRPLGELLDATAALLTKYVIFKDATQPIAIALWIAHTHALAAFDVTPYVLVTSPEKRSAKSRLLELLESLVARPWRVVEATAPAIFRKIKRDEPTILLDEVDAIFKTKSSETAEALRGVLNAGYRRGACVPRCTGKDYEKLEDFPVFGAKALAGIGRVPDTIADRSVPICLHRKRPSESVARFGFRTIRAETVLVQRALATWGKSAVASLRDARPAVPASLNDRASEIWEPLLGIAEAAGGDWPGRARQAAVTLHGHDAEAASVGVLLLAAIREVFTSMGGKVLTVDLLEQLVEREHEPWGGWWGADVDKALKDGVTPKRPAMELARNLRGFGVLPKEVRTPAAGKGKGYDRADFEDAFSRYLAPEGAEGGEDPSEGRDTATTLAGEGFEDSRPGGAREVVATPETLAGEGLSRVATSEGGTCAVCGLDTIARASDGEAWCVDCYPVTEWSARVVERESGEDDVGDGRSNGTAAGRELGAEFTTGSWQACARCGGSRWRHRGVLGDECVACHPVPAETAD